MGIPYSKQINTAFDQVAPLVAATLDVLHTTRNISYLLAAVQVLTAVLQLVTVFAIIGLLITVNPDLTKERKALVTPVLQYLASYVMPGSEGRWYMKVIGWTLAWVWLFGCALAAWYAVTENKRQVAVKDELKADAKAEMERGAEGDGDLGNAGND